MHSSSQPLSWHHLCLAHADKNFKAFLLRAKWAFYVIAENEKSISNPSWWMAWKRMHFMILCTSGLSKDGRSQDSEMMKLERKTNTNWVKQTYSQRNKSKPGGWCMVFKVVRELNKSSYCFNHLFNPVHLIQCILCQTLNSMSALESNQEFMIVHVIRVQGMCHVNRYEEPPLNCYLKQLIIRDGGVSDS